MIFSKIKISVCIPVYRTEALLEKCIASVLAQDFNQIELIVVNDASNPDSGQENVSAIIKRVKKSSKIPVKLINHSENLGLVEARRSAVFAAKGEYIFNLDSDDTIPSDALSSLYKIAQETNADIIQGKLKVYGNVEESILKKRQAPFDCIYTDKIDSYESSLILDYFLVEKKINSYLCGKLIRRSVYENAFYRIPSVWCTFAEDLLQSVWIFYYASSYIGTDKVVYYYDIENGISSRTMIKDLSRWEKVCSTSSVFAAIAAECENENPFTDKQLDSIKMLCQKYVANNLLQLEKAVVPELQKEARVMLEEYWGKDLVDYVEKKVASAGVDTA